MHTDKVDHYSQPSKMRVPTSVFFESFVMVDGMLFELRNSNEDLSKYDIHNSFVWVPVKLLKADKEDNAQNDAKKQEDELAEDLKSDKTKKKKFGAFMKDLTDKAKEIANTSMGASLPTIIKELDSRAAVRNNQNCAHSSTG
ncbi:MAG TPA: hypothetical protein EYP79_01790 [Campylobacterales bacterium]|nr:hypothetical protein [Campylobacterales bacterium]